MKGYVVSTDMTEAVDIREKKEQLKQTLLDVTRQDVMVAYSGGVDSALLTAMLVEAACVHHTRVLAVTAVTRLHPMGELEAAKQVAKELSVEHDVVVVDELSEAGIANNPPDRCYLCKKCIYERMLQLAKEQSITVLLDGTNASDLEEYRPGLKALQELKVSSPFAACGLKKSEVRVLAKEYHISVADKPASPCMATRFPYGTQLSYESLEQVAKAEHLIRERGFYNVRVRVYDKLVRLEVDEEDMPLLLSKRQELLTKLKQLGYIYVTMDLEGFRSGSMDVELITVCRKV